MTEKILIAYYSRSGNTEKTAKMIHQEMGGKRHRIIPETPYPKSYDATVDQAKQEIKHGTQPPLINQLDSVAGYHLIFIGSPNWWSTIAPPVSTFLTSYDFAGKTLALFCTHGGGGLGRMASDIAKLCPKSNLLSPFTVYGSGGRGVNVDLAAWLNEIKTSLS